MKVSEFTAQTSALAKMRAQQVAQAKLSPNTSDVYSDAHVFAVVSGVYPIFDEDVGEAETRMELLQANPFYGTYIVGRNQVKQLYEILSDSWRRGEKTVTVYGLESIFGRGRHSTWRGGHWRHELINCLRYFRLSGKFDDAFWKAVLSDAPVEAEAITRPLEEQELLQTLM